MAVLVTFLRVAGFVQIAIAAANFILPGKLGYRENLGRVSPIIRQIFIVHSGYIVGILLLFAALSIRFASELANGKGIGQFLAAAIALFWLCRIPLQLLYYDKALRRKHRIGDLAFTVAIVCLALLYGAAALKPYL
jgi:hypothetical protein